MIKFHHDIDIKGSSLLLSFTSSGLTGNFASSVLLNNHNFECIGFFFSHFLSAYVGINPNNGSVIFNGQVYFNKEKRILLINFHSGVSYQFRNPFCLELLSLYEKYNLNKFLIYGGIGKGFTNDTELKNKNIDVYYLTNDTSLNPAKFNLKNFVDLVKLENKKKPLEEVKFLENSGIPRHLIKFLNKKCIPFNYLFAFSNELFDPLAGIAVYYKLGLILGFTNDDVVIPKYSESLNLFLENIESQFKIESTWKLFLKE